MKKSTLRKDKYTQESGIRTSFFELKISCKHRRIPLLVMPALSLQHFGMYFAGCTLPLKLKVPPHAHLPQKPCSSRSHRLLWIPGFPGKLCPAVGAALIHWEPVQDVAPWHTQPSCVPIPGLLTDLQLPLDPALAALPVVSLRGIVLGHHLHELAGQCGVLRGKRRREGAEGPMGGRALLPWQQGRLSPEHLLHLQPPQKHFQPKCCSNECDRAQGGEVAAGDMSPGEWIRGIPHPALPKHSLLP